MFWGLEPIVLAQGLPKKIMEQGACKETGELGMRQAKGQSGMHIEEIKAVTLSFPAITQGLTQNGAYK